MGVVGADERVGDMSAGRKQDECRRRAKDISDMRWSHGSAGPVLINAVRPPKQSFSRGLQSFGFAMNYKRTKHKLCVSWKTIEVMKQPFKAKAKSP